MEVLTEEFLEMLEECLRQKGYYLNKEEKTDEILLSIYREGNWLGVILNDGIGFANTSDLKEEQELLRNTFYEIKEAYEVYSRGTSLSFENLEEYHLVSEYRDCLLAGKITKEGALHYTTWLYDYNRTGVTMGHYFETNYEGAKEDFAIRSGLVKEVKKSDMELSKEEWISLCKSCVFRQHYDLDLKREEYEIVLGLVEKLKEKIPQIAFEEMKQELEEELEQ